MYTVVRKLIHIQYICMYPTLIHTNTLIHILTYTHELGLGDIAIIVHIMILFHPVELLLSVMFCHKHGIRLLYYLFQIQIFAFYFFVELHLNFRIFVVGFRQSAVSTIIEMLFWTEIMAD